MQSIQTPTRFIQCIWLNPDKQSYTFQLIGEQYSIFSFTYNPSFEPWDNMALARYIYQLNYKGDYSTDEALVNLYQRKEFKDIVATVNESEVVQSDEHSKIMILKNEYIDLNFEEKSVLTVQQCKDQLGQFQTESQPLIQKFIVNKIQESQPKTIYAIIEDSTATALEGPLYHINRALFLGHYQEANEIWKYYKVFENSYPSEEELQQIQAFVITGSPCTAYIPEPWYPPYFKFLERILESQRRIIGTCFGHQIVAQAFGGQTEQLKNLPEEHHVHYGVKELKSTLTDRVISMHVYHADNVIEPPPNSKIIMTSDHCANMAYLNESGNFLGVQFHPEFSIPLIKYLISNKSPITDPKELISRFDSSTHRSCQDSVEIRKLLLSFLKKGTVFSV